MAKVLTPKFLFIFIFLSVNYFSVVCHAQYLTGPVASSLGGAGRAANEDGEQFIHNPANVIQASVVSSSLFYLDGYNAKNEHENLWGLSLTDNSEDLLLAGAYVFAHRKRSFANQAQLTEDYHQVSTGQFILKHFSLGASVTYLHSHIEDAKNYDQFNGHIGALYNPVPEFAVGLVAYNIAGRDLSVPTEIQEGSKLAAGVMWIIDPMVRMRFDLCHVLVQNPDKKFEYQLGFESKTSDLFILRAGFDQDDLSDRKYWSMGLAFDGPRAKIDYIYRKNFEYGGAALHGVDIRVPFW